MGLFGGSSSSSSSSTSTTTSWLSDMLEPIVTDFVDNWQGIDWEDNTIAGLTPAEQSALDAYGSGAAITTGKNIAQGGANLVQESIGRIEGLLNGGAKSQFSNAASSIYSGTADWQNTQDAAIQNDVYSQMANEFGGAAQSTMASTAVSGSSAAQNEQASILASGANSMASQEADIASQAGKLALRGAAGGLSGEVNLIDSLMKEGGSIFDTGANIAKSGQDNQFKSGLFEQWYNQETADTNRNNDMMSGNMDYLNMAALLDMVLPTSNIDTTTTGTSKVSGHKSGLL